VQLNRNWTAFLAFTIALTLSSVVRADEPIRIVAGLHSADKLLDDLEYIIVEKAGAKKSWEENIFPNIEIFLEGVDTTFPVRRDMLLDKERGNYNQFIIPITNLDGFLLDNLDPIGIIAERDRRDRELYELTGDIYEGWLRVLHRPKVVILSPEKTDIPKGMPHPYRLHKELVDANYLVFAELLNKADGIESRRKIFETFRDNTIKALEQLEDESDAAFQLRVQQKKNQLSLLGLWVAELKHFRYGLTIDQKAHTGTSSVLFSPLPDTRLAKSVGELGTKASQFAAAKRPEDSVMSLRLNIPVDDIRVKEVQQVYELSRPVLDAAIDENEGPTAVEKAASKEIASLLNDVLVASTSTDGIDAFAEIYPAGEFHTAVVGVECKGQDKILELVKKLPEAVSVLTVKMDADKVGDLAIHHIQIGDALPGSLKDFYGPSGDIYVAVSDTAFWFSGGENALKDLKSTIESVTSAEDVKPDGKMVDLMMKTAPMLEAIYQLQQEEDLGLVDILLNRAKAQRKSLQKDKKRKTEESESRVAALADFEWEETAIKALTGSSDTLTLIIEKNEDGDIEGTSVGEEGILKAVGKIIAKFADENLN